MANQNNEKAILGYAISTNSILQKIESISESTNTSIQKIEHIATITSSTMQGLLTAVSRNTKVLTEIKETLQKQTEHRSKLSSNIDMKKLAGVAGAIAVVGFGIFSLSMAFNAAEGVSPSAILSGVAIMASLIPMIAVIQAILNHESASVFMKPSVLSNFAKSTIVVGLTTLGMAHLISRMPNVSGSQMLTLLAVSAAMYIQGKIFIELIKAWQFSGFIDKYLNKSNTDEIMGAMRSMAINMVIIAGAMILMPKVSIEHAAAFVVATAAMIPLAASLVVVRFAIPALKNMDRKSIMKFGAVTSVMALAMIPIGFAAKALGSLNITAKEIKTIVMLTAVMAPIAAIVSLFSAMINWRKESISAKAAKGPKESLLNRDNSKKRRAELRPRQIKQFTLIAGLSLVGLAVLGVMIGAAAPTIAKGIRATASIDYIGLLKFISLVGFATILMGASIALFVRMMKGKENSTSSSSFIGRRGAGSRSSSSSKPGKITTNDMIMATIAIPIIILGIALAALAFRFMPEVPKISNPLGFLQFVALSGIALTVFVIPISIIAKATRGLSLKQLGMMALVIPVLSFTILATAWMFQLLPGEFKSPGLEWSAKSALSVLIFGVAVLAVSYMYKNMDLKDVMKGLGAVVLIAFGVIAVAFLFQAFSGISVSTLPGIEYFVILAGSIGAFTGIMLAVGKIAQTLGPQGLGYAAIGIILIAVIILVVSYILAAISPVTGALEKVAASFTKIIFMPVNAMVDIFKRFKDEIGIDQMQPLATGILWLAGAWLALVGALAGQAAGGLFGSISGAAESFIDGIASLWGGGKERETPLTILEKLSEIGPKLVKLADPMLNISKSFYKISMSAFGAVRAFSAVTKFGETESVNNMGKASIHLSSIAKSYSSISKSSKVMNVEAINATSDMFKALTDLAKSNGKDAISMLADNLMKAVQELSTVVLNLETSVNEQSGSNKTFSEAIGGAVSTLTDKVLSVKDSAESSGDPEAIGTMKEVVTAIQDLEELLSSGIYVAPIPDTIWPSN